MKPRKYANPFYIFLLVLPWGMSIGFVLVALPNLLTVKGFSVAEAASIVALGFSANIWRFLWGPLADMTLSLNRWYWIGVISCIATLLLLCLMPFDKDKAIVLTVVVFLSQIAATFVVLPVGGIMAHRIEENKKGRAGGWFQAGNLGGVGLGGGVGLWLATHYSLFIAGLVLSAMMILPALIILLIEDVKRDKQKTIANEIKMMGKEMIGMVRVPMVLFVIIVLTLPIGTSAASNLWSAIATDWKVSSDMVALVVGILSSVAGAAGCIAGGWITDRYGVWRSYFGAGLACALVPALMAAFPYTPVIFIYGVLIYAFAVGLLNAAFTTLALFVSGKKAASTKYSLLSSIGNLPVVYMTAYEGFVHDRSGSKYMLLLEAAWCALCVLICIAVLKWMKGRNLILKSVDADAA